MGGSCFKASSSNEPVEEEVDDNAVPWTLTPWLGLRIDNRSTGETSNASGSNPSPALEDDENESSANEIIPTEEPVPRMSQEQWSAYKSLSENTSKIEGLAFSLDNAELMQVYLKKLIEPEIPNDPRRLYRNTPMIFPARFQERVYYITNGELPDSRTLKRRLEEKFLYEGLEFEITMEAVNAINIGLTTYLKRTLEARFANAAPGRMILPLNKLESNRVAIWLHPSLTTILEKMPRYDSALKRKEPKPRVYVVDSSQTWQKYSEDLFNRLECQVLRADCAYEALEFMGLIDGIPGEIGQLDMICSEYHMTEINGFELLSKMKNSDRWKNTPFVMASSENDPSLVNKCLELGADIFIMKPLLEQSSDVEELEYVLRKILY